MKYLLDTSAYSNLLKGNPILADIINNSEAIFVPSIVIAELRYGFRLGSRLEENERLLSRFLASKKVHGLLPDNATTDYFIAIATYARKNGIQLSHHDLWIAALAEQWDATLVSTDQDFKHLAHPDLNLQIIK